MADIKGINSNQRVNETTILPQDLKEVVGHFEVFKTKVTSQIEAYKGPKAERKATYRKISSQKLLQKYNESIKVQTLRKVFHEITKKI